MAAEPVQIPVPICETCWLIDHTRWEPESMNEEGLILMRLAGVDVPTKVNTDAVEICALCGGITVAGIYEKVDPAAVGYLRDDEESNLYGESARFLLNMNDDDMEDDLDDEQ